MNHPPGDTYRIFFKRKMNIKNIFVIKPFVESKINIFDNGKIFITYPKIRLLYFYKNKKY